MRQCDRVDGGCGRGATGLDPTDAGGGDDTIFGGNSDVSPTDGDDIIDGGTGSGEDGDESNDLYKKALKLNPKNPEAHYGLAVIREKLFKDAPGAESELRAALAINPRYSQAHDKLGEVLEKSFGKNGDAKQSYQLAIDTDPKNALARYHLGMLLWQKFHDTKQIGRASCRERVSSPV